MEQTVEETVSATFVNWSEWSDNAFARAKAEDKPILLDVGAVWCHWCHRMDKDTYNQPEVAAFINKHFVPIKVDNDRRPDINARYNMGGWPTTVFLTPDGEIITGATYVPPAQMINLMRQVQQAFHNNKDSLLQQTAQIARQREEASRPRARPDARLSWGIITQIVGSIARHYDPVYSGLGTEPKFPQAEAYDLLLAEYVNGGKRDDRLIEIVVKSLLAMGSGGMYDHVEGGWFRYSTTRDWSQPHFEKMTESHAALLTTYLQAFQVTGNQQIRATAEKSLSYMTRTLYDQARGTFAGSQDADEVYYMLSSVERTQRKAPFVDWTVYTDWNARMVGTLLLAGEVLDQPDYRSTGLRLLETLWPLAYDEQASRVFHYVDPDGPHLPGLLNDQTQLGRACLEAYQLTGNTSYLERAQKLVDYILVHLQDTEQGGFFDRPEDLLAQGALRTRQKPLFENAVTAEVLLLLHYLTGKHDYLDAAERALLVFTDEYARYEFMASPYGLAVSRAVNDPTEIVVVGDMSAAQPLLAAAQRVYVPWRVVLPLDPARDAATITTRGFPIQDEPAAFVCRNQTCSAPVTVPLDLVRLLADHSAHLNSAIT
jgi:uncharacterized protein YyaL (SSP411 family)